MQGLPCWKLGRSCSSFIPANRPVAKITENGQVVKIDLNADEDFHLLVIFSKGQGSIPIVGRFQVLSDYGKPGPSDQLVEGCYFRQLMEFGGFLPGKVIQSVDQDGFQCLSLHLHHFGNDRDGQALLAFGRLHQ
jgi:hypothetical protein